MARSEVKNIFAMIDYQKTMSKSFSSFFDDLVSKWRVIILGGSLREAIKGNYNPRDIDIILDSDNLHDFGKMLYENQIHYKKNRFGGFKLYFKHIEVDVWPINKHYAFENNFYSKSIENIVETTFLNYDSIAFDYQEQKLYKRYYEQCINSHSIELIGNDDYIDKNPTPNINVIRMLKIEKETGYKLSHKSVSYIEKYIDECNDKHINIHQKLVDGFYSHYNKMIDQYILDAVDAILKKR